MEGKNRQWLLARRPAGMIEPADFQWVTGPVPAPADGEVLVRNLWLSCDPAQRGWIAGDTYLPAVKIGEVVRSFAVGSVVESRHPKFKAGQLVQGLFGWQDFACAGPGTPSALAPVPEGVPVETAMSALGPTGITAYFGLLDVGRPKAGDTVVVSGAAGATGSAVGQIAKIQGCRTIGIAGGAEKCRWLTEDYGFDAAVDYKSENVGKKLRELCPNGIDVFFDNVGGEILDLALARLAMRGRVVLCGAIARYNDAAQGRHRALDEGRPLQGSRRRAAGARERSRDAPAPLQGREPRQAAPAHRGEVRSAIAADSDDRQRDEGQRDLRPT